jgi:AraC-like DNA-binding protein
VPGSIPWHSSQTEFPRYQRRFHENGFTRITTKWLSLRVWSTRTSCYVLPDVLIPSTNSSDTALARHGGKGDSVDCRELLQDLARGRTGELSSMGVSTLHHHFRMLTSMSPLQYQKQLRLQSARNLMLNSGMDASSAAFEVGYESPTQFNREYSRFFGQPPIKDVRALRESGTGPSEPMTQQIA